MTNRSAADLDRFWGVFESTTRIAVAIILGSGSALGLIYFGAPTLLSLAVGVSLAGVVMATKHCNYCKKLREYLVEKERLKS